MGRTNSPIGLCAVVAIVLARLVMVVHLHGQICVGVGPVQQDIVDIVFVSVRLATVTYAGYSTQEHFGDRKSTPD